jgi:hypothetical protein
VDWFRWMIAGLLALAILDLRDRVIRVRGKKRRPSVGRLMLFILIIAVNFSILSCTYLDRSTESSDFAAHGYAAWWCRDKAVREDQLANEWKTKAGIRPDLRVFCDREAARHVAWGHALRQQAAWRDGRAAWCHTLGFFISLSNEQGRAMQGLIRELGLVERAEQRQIAAEEEFSKRAESPVGDAERP